MIKISEHISFDEATHSDKAMELAIENIPNVKQLANMLLIANNVFEPLRKIIGKPIKVNSFFRSEKLNSSTKGSSATSQHCALNGAAMDLSATAGFTNKLIFDTIKNKLKFDQLIWEFGTNNEPKWVHVSYKQMANRNMVLKSVYGANGEVKYMTV